MMNKSPFLNCLWAVAAAILPFGAAAQVFSTSLQAIASNGNLTLQMSSWAATDSLFVRDTSNQVTLEFSFAPNDPRNGLHSAQPALQTQGDVHLRFQSIAWLVGDALTFSAAQYGPDGRIIRSYNFVNGDYTGPDSPAPPVCPVSISCTNQTGISLNFNPQQYLAQKARTMSLSFSFGADNPYNGIYQTNGADNVTNSIYVERSIGCDAPLSGKALLIFDGLVCQYENRQLVAPTCSPFGDYYTPGDVCAEYFENCAGKLISALLDKRSELPCRQWKEAQSSACGTNTYIYRTGKVSIGTDKQAPRSSVAGSKASLSVKNGVITDLVKVKMCDNYWCDYVFEPGYSLRSLPETEAYILQNCHLPGMPSGGSIESEGAFELGDITRLQQEKIEEAYLHLIQLQAQLEYAEALLTWLEWQEESRTK